MRLDKRGRRIGRNAWRDFVMDAYSGAAHAWFLAAEAATLGYATELAEYAAQHPRPTLRAFLIGLAGTWNVEHETVEVVR